VAESRRHPPVARAPIHRSSDSPRRHASEAT
jgi:hypothetical protein